LNNKITIISTYAYHSNREVALASMNNECVQNETSYETTNYIFLPLCNLSTFKLLSYTQFKGGARLRHTVFEATGPLQMAAAR